MMRTPAEQTVGLYQVWERVRNAGVQAVLVQQPGDVLALRLLRPDITGLRLEVVCVAGGYDVWEQVRPDRFLAGDGLALVQTSLTAEQVVGVLVAEYRRVQESPS